MIKIYLIILIGFFFSVSCEIKNRKIELPKNNRYLNYIVGTGSYGVNTFQLESNNISYAALFVSKWEDCYIYLIKNNSIVLDSVKFEDTGDFYFFQQMNTSRLYFSISQSVRRPSASYIMGVLNDKIHFSYEGDSDDYDDNACTPIIDPNDPDDYIPDLSIYKNKFSADIISADTFDNFDNFKILKIVSVQECDKKINHDINVMSFIYDSLEHTYKLKK